MGSVHLLLHTILRIIYNIKFNKDFRRTVQYDIQPYGSKAKRPLCLILHVFPYTCRFRWKFFSVGRTDGEQAISEVKVIFRLCGNNISKHLTYSCTTKPLLSGLCMNSLFICTDSIKLLSHAILRIIYNTKFKKILGAPYSMTQPYRIKSEKANYCCVCIQFCKCFPYLPISMRIFLCWPNRRRAGDIRGQGHIQAVRQPCWLPVTIDKGIS